MSDPSKTARPKSRLGRGLSSLISISSEEAPAEAGSTGGALPVMREIPAPAPEPGVRVIEIPLASIVPNPHQPRRDFDETTLGELAASLKTTGMIQPIVVRPDGQGTGAYQLIAGERRWRAARLADLPAIPAIVRDVDGATQAQMALIENIQRENLNPLDRALAYRALMDHLGLTQAELASRLGEDRSTVANFLRLLDLSEPVRQLVREDQLSLGHAKLLAGVTDTSEQERLARLVVSQSLSVRNLERLIAVGMAAAEAKEKDNPTGPSAYLKDLERSLSRQLSMRVQVRASSRQKGRGKLILHYTSLDQFDDLMGRLGAKTE